jgi:hypothetical protein
MIGTTHRRSTAASSQSSPWRQWRILNRLGESLERENGRGKRGRAEVAASGKMFEEVENVIVWMKAPRLYLAACGFTDFEACFSCLARLSLCRVTELDW